MLWKSALRLAVPYWKSRDSRAGLALAIAIMVLGGLLSFIQVESNPWTVKFYNALQRLDSKSFSAMVPMVIVFTAIATVVSVSQEYLHWWLGLRWRRGLVDHLLDGWLKHAAYYRLERDHRADNPDQRIAEDAKQFVNLTMTLTFGLATMLMSLWSYSYITWTVGGAADINVLGRALHIPGYMFWLAVVFAIANILLTHLSGRTLVSLNFATEAKEADFRYSLIQVRDHAEQIALYAGEDTERRTLTRRFASIWEVSKRSFYINARLALASRLLNSVSMLMPVFVMAPQLFAGKTDFGSIMGIISAWSMTAMSLSWIAQSYSSIAQWRAVVARLDSLLQSIEEPKPQSAIALETTADGKSIRLQHLNLTLPNGRPLASVKDLVISKGDRWMITGATGCGKSTLLRAIAGLWPFGSGTISYPHDLKTMFLPQKSYIPQGSLKAALCYPGGPERFSDAACSEVLAICRLGSFCDRLHSHGSWSKSMSLGEQQRLAIARAMLARPAVLFLDEATSSVDADTERALYSALIQVLPAAAIISVAHRLALREYHSHFLELGDSVSQAQPATLR